MTRLRFADWGLLLSLALVLIEGAQAEAPQVDARGSAREQHPDAAVVSPADAARRAQVVAKGKGFQITLGAVEDYINKQPPVLRARYLAPEEKRALLANLLRLELLAGEAEERGLAKNPAVRQTVKDGAVQSLVRTEIDEKVTAQSISKEDVAAFYAENPQDFHHAAERRASHILVDTLEQAKALLAEAKAADLRAFGELARRQSLDGETKLRGGDLAFFTREPGPPDGRKVPEAIRKAVFELKSVGDTIEKPLEMDGQFSIVRFTGERPERHVSLAEADGTIRSKLWREQRQKAVTALLERLRAKDKPKVFAERVDLVTFDDMEKRPTGFAPEPARPASPHARPRAPQPAPKAP